MGTTLTGTTPANTYDSLIKVTDNGPLSGTAKYLSDGLGNDSVLALSNARVGIGTTTPVSALTVVGTTTSGITIQSSDAASNGLKIFNDSTTDTASIVNHYSGPLVFGTANAESMRITSAGNVGIGTSSPNYSLQVNSSTTTTRLQITNSTTGTSAANGLQIIQDGVNTTVSQKSNGFMSFETNNNERFRITANGVTFNGDTAAANALDDYEEGTWTMGLAFNQASVGITYAYNTGQYTKVGRKVTVVGFLSISNKGTSTGSATITGLPFTIASGTSNYSSACLSQVNLITVPLASYISGYGTVGGNSIVLQATSTTGSLSNLSDGDFSNNSEIMVSLTYFV